MDEDGMPLRPFAVQPPHPAVTYMPGSPMMVRAVVTTQKMYACAYISFVRARGISEVFS